MQRGNIFSVESFSFACVVPRAVPFQALSWIILKLRSRRLLALDSFGQLWGSKRCFTINSSCGEVQQFSEPYVILAPYSSLAGGVAMSSRSIISLVAGSYL